MADIPLDKIVLQSPNKQHTMQISLTDAGALEVRLLLPDGNGGWKSDQRASKPLARSQTDRGNVRCAVGIE
jgi:hypothetical protein